MRLGEKENIYLIGFMGSGKTTVANRLGQIFGKRKMEMDDVIEGRAGMPIPMIFERQGEESFREQETQVLRDITMDGAVISCGGGTPLREENRALMKKSGKIVYLTVRPETVLQRIERGQTTRPVLKGHMDEDYVHDLIQKRDPAYRNCADFIIETDGKDVETICKEITFKLLSSNS